MLFTFKNAHNLPKKPASFSKMVFRRLFDIARISNFNEEELMDYESEMKHFSDHANALVYAKKKGRMEGLLDGIMQTAKNMLAKGYSVAEVIGVTKLSREQVRALR
jgi:predicted transposase/invertase (TIGR01784 family)